MEDSQKGLTSCERFSVDRTASSAAGLLLALATLLVVITPAQGIVAVGVAFARVVITPAQGIVAVGVAFVAMKENIRVDGKRDIQTKVMTTLFALFAEVERDLISERTREGLAKARSAGRKLGRPKGSLGVSRLNGKEDDIRRFLDLGVSKTTIAKLTGVSRTALYSFMSTRGLKLSP